MKTQSATQIQKSQFSSLEEKCKQLEVEKNTLEIQKNFYKLWMENYKSECKVYKTIIKDMKENEAKLETKYLKLKAKMENHLNKKDEENLNCVKKVILTKIDALEKEEKFLSEKDTMLAKIEALEANIDTLEKEMPSNSFSEMSAFSFDHENASTIKLEEKTEISEI